MKHSKKKISTYFCIAVLCLISVAGCSGQKESTPKPELIRFIMTLCVNRKFPLILLLKLFLH